MAGGDFLARLHGNFGMPRPDVVGFVEGGVGSGVAEMERLALGDENEVYRVWLLSGEIVYVRIRRPDAGNFNAEVWAMDQARSADVAVPEILALDELATAEGPRAAMVVAAAPGRQLEQLLPTLTAAQRRIALINLGGTLAEIHTVHTPGVGRPDTSGHWTDPQIVMDTFMAERIGQRSQLISAGLAPSEADRVIDKIGESPDIPAPIAPVLCHGDLHAGHVFIDDQLTVCGVIDWGLWHGGSVIDDLSSMFIHYADEDFGAILAGHGGESDGPEFRRRLALAVINQTVGHVAWHESVGNTCGIKHGVETLRAALRQLHQVG